MPVAVISRGLATRLFPDQDPLGHRVRVGAQELEPFTIVGVAPEKFRGTLIDWLGRNPDVWISAAKLPAAMPGVAKTFDFLAARKAASFVVTGRLAAGVSAAQAQADVGRLRAAIEQDFGDAAEGWTAEVYPLAESRFWPGHRDSVSTQLTVLTGVAGLILLVLAGVISPPLAFLLGGAA